MLPTVVSDGCAAVIRLPSFCMISISSPEKKPQSLHDPVVHILKPQTDPYERDPQIHCPAEFISNPNQTHLSMIINVFRIIRKSRFGEFDQGRS